MTFEDTTTAPRWWKSGENPPGGMYLGEFGTDAIIVKINNKECSARFRVLGMDRAPSIQMALKEVGPLYGPIPEPEVKS
jgi:hypothetical protein